MTMFARVWTGAGKRRMMTVIGRRSRTAEQPTDAGRVRDAS
jgi:hypothetical protein